VVKKYYLSKSVVKNILFRPIDIASLVYFRIGFGLLMLLDTFREFGSPSFLQYWSNPQTPLYFKYYGFSWVKVYWDMGLHVWALRLFAVFIIIGFLYRISAILFFLAFTYIFLLDQSLYQNHFYFICWVSFALIFMPANRCFSIDARLRRSIRSDTTPAWTIAVLTGLMGVVYFYGGLAKINHDWLRGWPLFIWLPRALGDIGTQEWFVYTFTYGGLFFDLFIVPLLIWRKSRPYAFAACVIFHLSNAFIFQIGIFPWLSIVTTALFLPLDWPRNCIKRIAKKIGKGPVLTPPRPGRLPS